jgi:hypothetical protein
MALVAPMLIGLPAFVELQVDLESPSWRTRLSPARAASPRRC